MKTFQMTLDGGSVVLVLTALAETKAKATCQMLYELTILISKTQDKKQADLYRHWHLQLAHQNMKPHELINNKLGCTCEVIGRFATVER